MAIPFLSPIDMNQNEIQNFKVQNLGTDPSTPGLGQMWFNTGTSLLKIYDGVGNRALAELVNRLDQFAAPTASVSFNSQKITNLLDPTSAQDAATKGYVDSVALGLDVKASVVAATTVTGTLSTAYANGSVVDGVTLATGNRILIKNQSSGSENGIYTVNASGAPTRSTDTNSSSNYVSGAFTFVEQGTTNAGSSWVVSTQGTITPGTTSVLWVQFSGSGATYTAGSGGALTLTGTAFAVNTDGSTIEISSNNLRVKSSTTANQTLLSGGSGAAPTWGALPISNSAAVTGALAITNGGTGATSASAARTALSVPTKFSSTIGDGSSTSIAVTHSLGTSDVIVEVFNVATPFQRVQCEIQHTSTTVCTLLFGTAPTTNQLRVVIVG